MVCIFLFDSKYPTIATSSVTNIKQTVSGISHRKINGKLEKLSNQNPGQDSYQPTCQSEVSWLHQQSRISNLMTVVNLCTNS